MFVVIYLVYYYIRTWGEGIRPNVGGRGYFWGPIRVLTVACCPVRCRAPPAFNLEPLILRFKPKPSLPHTGNICRLQVVHDECEFGHIHNTHGRKTRFPKRSRSMTGFTVLHEPPARAGTVQGVPTTGTEPAHDHKKPHASHLRYQKL